MRIVCLQMILMKYSALFVIFEKAANFEIYIKGKKQNKWPLGLVRTVGLMIYQFRSQELHQDTICEKFITEVTKLPSESHVMASSGTEVSIWR